MKEKNTLKHDQSLSDSNKYFHQHAFK